MLSLFPGGSTHRYCGDKQATIYPELVGLEQEDPVLIKALKERVLIPPPPKEYVLNLQNEQLWNDLKGQFGQVDVIRQHGKDFGIDIKKRGFFIEAGASDGENISNTLYLEKKYNWKGLLVEPNPDFADGLIKKKRQAWILPHCLSIHNTSTIENFDNIAFWGGIINSNKNKMPGDIRKETITEDYPSSYKRRLIKVRIMDVKTRGHQLNYYVGLIRAFNSFYPESTALLKIDFSRSQSQVPNFFLTFVKKSTLKSTLLDLTSGKSNFN